MNDETVRNESLFQRIKKLVSAERRIGVEILGVLFEIEQRKAYAELRYDGLFTYCVKELGFSDSQAYQRIQAMRALKEIPELRIKIEQGSLSVSTVSKVRTHLKKEAKAGKRRSEGEALGLFVAMENKTSREVDQKLAEEKGEKLYSKLFIEMDEELDALWTQVKNLSAHKTQGDPSDILKLLAREWLKKNDPAREVRLKKVPMKAAGLGKVAGHEARAQELGAHEIGTDDVLGSSSGSQRAVPSSTRVAVPRAGSATTSCNAEQFSRSRHIPAQMRRKVCQRDQGQCVHCGSRFAVVADHQWEFALGGRHEEKNLRLLCRSCNQYRAVARFGKKAAIRARPVFTRPMG